MSISGYYLELLRIAFPQAWVITEIVVVVLSALAFILQRFVPQIAANVPMSDLLLLAPLGIFLIIALFRFVLYAPFLLHKRQYEEIARLRERGSLDLDVQVSGISSIAAGLIPEDPRDYRLLRFQNTRITNRSQRPVSVSFMLKINDELLIPSVQQDMLNFIKKPHQGFLFRPLDVGPESSSFGDIGFLFSPEKAHLNISTGSLWLEIRDHISNKIKLVEVGGKDNHNL